MFIKTIIKFLLNFLKELKLLHINTLIIIYINDNIVKKIVYDLLHRNMYNTLTITQRFEMQIKEKRKKNEVDEDTDQAIEEGRICCKSNNFSCNLVLNCNLVRKLIPN